MIMLEPKDAMLLELHRTIQHLKKENMKLAQQVQDMSGGRPASTAASLQGGGFAAGPRGSQAGFDAGRLVGEGGAGPGEFERPKTRKGTRGGTGAGAGSLSGPIPYPPGSQQGSRGGARGGRSGGRPGFAGVDSPLSSSSTEPSLPRRAASCPLPHPPFSAAGLWAPQAPLNRN